MKLKLVIFSIVIGYFFTSCELDNDVKACFSMEPESGFKSRTLISFENCSENANYYLWCFGDSITIMSERTTHIYKNAGTYTITLVAQKKDFTDVNLDGIINELDISSKDSDSITETIIVQ